MKFSDNKHEELRRQIATEMARAELGELSGAIPFDKLHNVLQEQRIKRMLPLADITIKYMASQLKESLKELFQSGELSITTDVEIQQAQGGDGQWNITKTRVMLDKEVVMEEEGRCDICLEPR